MRSHGKKVLKNKSVVLKGLPPGFIDDLPLEDQQAISSVVGKSVVLLGYDEDGRAELEFTAKDGVIHCIWVQPKFVAAVKSRRARRPIPSSPSARKRRKGS